MRLRSSEAGRSGSLATLMRAWRRLGNDLGKIFRFPGAG